VHLALPASLLRSWSCNQCFLHPLCDKQAVLATAQYEEGAGACPAEQVQLLQAHGR